MVKRVIQYEIEAENRGKKISSFLIMKGYPQRVLTLLRKKEGSIRINGIPVHMNRKLLDEGKSEILSVYIEENSSSDNIAPVNIEVDIVYEDDDIVVVNKPARMPVHPSLNNFDNTLGNAMAFYFANKGEPFVYRCINRLDRDTTGLTILAKHYLAAGILSKAMQDRRISREYTAIVEGMLLPKEGIIDLPIGRKEESMILREVDFENGERAITSYCVVDYNKDLDLSVVKLRLETGRTHQIRVHMKTIGHPLAGDFLYNPESTIMDRQALHAGKISFSHPITGELMCFEAALPEDMRILRSRML